MTEHTGKTAIPGSERAALDREPIGNVPGNELIDVMIVLKPDLDDAARHRLMTFLEDQGLPVHTVYEPTGSIHVRAPAAALQAAFSVRLARFAGEAGDQFRGRSGPVYVPDEIADSVTAVLGLDDRNVAQPWLAVAPHAGSTSLTPLQVAKAYQFPAGDGRGQTVGIIELGGGFTQADLNAYLDSLAVPRTTATVVSVMGATSSPDGPNGADGEVMLDVEIIAAIAPGANIRVYFAPNTTAGFLAAINQVVQDGCDVMSISWGGPESRWTSQAMTAYDQAFAVALRAGCTVFAASGDRGSSDGVPGGGVHVDFPASSPHATGCGGTRLTLTSSGTIASQVVWNDDPTRSATGGGYSAFFIKPAYQAAVPGSKRGVPDVAGDADPATGYPIRVDGQSMVIGGTSAVAPLMSGLTLRLNQLSGHAVGDFNTVAYANAGDFTDVTQGNNGAYSAGVGWDPTTGLGSPIGVKLQATLGSRASSGPVASTSSPLLNGDRDSSGPRSIRSRARPTRCGRPRRPGRGARP